MKKPNEDMIFRKLAEAISHLTCELRETREQRRNECDWIKSLSALASKCDLENVKDIIMASIAEYSAAVNASFDQISTSVDGVAADVTALKKKIDELQNSPGGITPADQALLDDIQAKAGALAAKVKTLDDQTADGVIPEPPPA